jgi:hypothetical protein
MSPTISRLNAPATPRGAADSVVLMIEIRALTKTYGPATAASDLTFTVRPGVVKRDEVSARNGRPGGHHDPAGPDVPSLMKPIANVARAC